MANILFERQLGSTHSSLSTIFFVVLAYGKKRDNHTWFVKIHMINNEYLGQH